MRAKIATPRRGFVKLRRLPRQLVHLGKHNSPLRRLPVAAAVQETAEPHDPVPDRDRRREAIGNGPEGHFVTAENKGNRQETGDKPA